ncbi:MAG: DUF3592 domain-containing protein [Ruminococcus flavefaciens]|nr:DUF3592 domain-containing protein [Ruminococcus flavefaciens]MCM1232806.1 DUF3592 domain-containing protein [Ruminococcus flavefaciens]
MRQVKWNTIIFASVILLIISLFSLFTEYRREKVCTELAVAEIVRIERKSSRTDTKYRLVVRYTYNGKEYRRKGKYFRYKPDYRADDIIPIRFNPKNPSEYYISCETAYSRNFIFAGISVFGITSGVFAVIIGRKKNDYY